MICAEVIPIPSRECRRAFSYPAFTKNVAPGLYTERMDSQIVMLGRRIAAARNARGWSKAELARRAGVAPSYITRVERGEFLRPSIDQIKTISDALGVNVTDLTEPPRAPISPGILGELGTSTIRHDWKSAGRIVRQWHLTR